MELLERLQTTLGGAYRVERELKAGGMARVFVATDTALGRPVVIKVLSPDLAEGVSSRRFAREIRLAAALQHANIVPVLSAAEASGIPHYMMPLVDGPSLRDRLLEPMPIPLVEAIGILRDVARALAYAHERGVVHRDIKPDNILLSGGAAMVTDFGIAKALAVALQGESPDGDTSARTAGTLTLAGNAVGTPAYMAPEQITAEPDVDHRTDLYAFGCLAYEVLAHRPLFGHRPAPQLLAAHLAEHPVRLGEHCPTCPQALIDLVHQCLAKDPARRPSSATEILRALDAVTTTTAPALTRIRRRLTRRPWAAGVLVAATIAAAAVVTLRGLGPKPGAGSDELSIAVLPFVNIGGDSTRNHWAEGLTDEVTMMLARRPSIRLATRGSVDRYHGLRNVDPQAVGRALRVRHVLYGTIWPEGGVFRVRAQLSRSDDGQPVWQDDFDGDAQRFLPALDSITEGISSAVQRALIGPDSGAPRAEPRPGSMRGTADTAAYERFLRAQALLRARGAAVRVAVERFEEAVALDPGFARAHAALAAALQVLPNFHDTTYTEVHARTTAAARRALDLDSTLARAHGALALASMHALRWAEADSQFKLALALDPADAETRMHYGRLLTYTGQWEAALAEFERAHALDPTSPVIGAWHARTLRLVGRTADAVRAMNRAVELDSTSVPTSFLAAEVALAAGQRARARALANQAWRPNGVPRPAPWPAATLEMFVALGDRETVAEIARHVETTRNSRAFHHSSLAMVAMAFGDTTRTFDELQRATEAGEFWPSAPILADRWTDLVRSSARMRQIVQRVGLNADRIMGLRGRNAR
jgi:serine/threonine-protein kinase